MNNEEFVTDVIKLMSTTYSVATINKGVNSLLNKQVPIKNKIFTILTTYRGSILKLTY